MSLAVTLVAGTIGLEGTLTHDALTDDKGRFAVGILSHGESTTDLVNVITVDLIYVPTPCTILGGCILGGYDLGLG